MKYRVTLNGKVYEVEVNQGEAQLLKEYEAVAPQAAPAPVVSAPQQTAAPAAPAASGNAITAPLPGTVVAIKATVGQTVKRGDVVMLIEAMKMENEISAPKDGKIVNILVQKGSTVETGTPIYEIG